eukprot:TRINITY_DN24915_c0_g2_i1.p1 TRINITY_DN24915_c0_g2~~TRINITY_DN24915_c0_g2_i1.p1  ORF type:complete len:468 (+),score=106.25 TRINITY_DN24915_c0_g2_i1:233-1636(+)
MLPLALASALLATASMPPGGIACPPGWSGLHGKCTIASMGVSLDWFAAEAYCRVRGGHLISLEEYSQVKYVFGLEPTWVGGRYSGGAWKWANRAEFKDLPSGTSLEAGDGLCLQHDAGSVVSAKCAKEQAFVCGLGAAGCFWEGAGLNFTGPVGVNGSSLDVVVEEGGRARIGGRSAMGTWRTPTEFVLEEELVPGCSFSARVAMSHAPSSASASGTVQAGPVLAAGCNGDLAPARFLKPPACLASERTYPTTHPDVAGSQTAGPAVATVTPAATPTTAPEYPSVDFPEPHSATSSVPVWVWPAAFGAVALVSVFVTFGVVKRRKAPKTPPMDDEDSPVSSEHMELEVVERPTCGHKRFNKDPNSCETCKKFNAGMAKRRLKAVHEQLAREFSLPIVVRGTHCEHNDTDHVHVFEVENDFDPSTMGALSTVYSRTKPRLPKNTRVHIVRATNETLGMEGGTDFSEFY